jgi:uncharacterized protein (UPF0305 family)
MLFLKKRNRTFKPVTMKPVTRSRPVSMSLFSFGRKNLTKAEETCAQIAKECQDLQAAATRGELGWKIAVLVLRHSPLDIQLMKRNFGKKVQDLDPEYRERLTNKINEHLLGTYQTIRLRHQQGTFGTMKEPVTPLQKSYWDMVAGQCFAAGDVNPRIRFLNYLLAAFCMFVLEEPGHPAGTPFPGGDTVQHMDGIYYCPVREKAGDVDAALCPYCPALQTPAIGYLKPPVNGSEHRKQEFIDNCYRYHNFNG